MCNDQDEKRLQELLARVSDLTRQEHLEACKLLGKRYKRMYGDKTMPNSAELIREMREERDLRIMGL